MQTLTASPAPPGFPFFGGIIQEEVGRGEGGRWEVEIKGASKTPAARTDLFARRTVHQGRKPPEREAKKRKLARAGELGEDGVRLLCGASAARWVVEIRLLRKTLCTAR